MSHVPTESLGVYRYWRDLAREADSLGGVLSGLNEHGLANAMWQAAAILKDRANSHRTPGRNETPHDET